MNQDVALKWLISPSRLLIKETYHKQNTITYSLLLAEWKYKHPQAWTLRWGYEPIVIDPALLENYKWVIK